MLLRNTHRFYAATPRRHSRARPLFILPIAQRHSRRAFTVLELLMVVGVLSILMAIVLPTIKPIHTATLKKRAQIEATALAQAAIRYKTEYGFWPGQLQPNNDAQGSLRLNDAVPKKDELLVLIAHGPQEIIDKIEVRDSAGSKVDDPNLLKLYDDNKPNGRLLYQAFSTVGYAASPPYPINPLNPKAITFLDLKQENDHVNIDYRDPWDQSYVLIMGLNPRQTYWFEVKDTSIRQTVSNQIAFAYSQGNPVHRGTNLIYSAGASP